MTKKHLDAPFTYDWPMANVAVDIVLTTEPSESEGCKVLLIRRGKDPYKGKLAMPGGFLDVLEDKTLLDAAFRELEEETKLTRDQLEELLIGDPIQTEVLGDIDRDPRGRVVSVVFHFRVRGEIKAVASDDAEPGSAQYIPVRLLPDESEFAFEHRQTILNAIYEECLPE